MSLTKNVLKRLAKSVLIPLRLTTAASEAEAEIHKKILGSGATILIILNKEMGDIMKIVKSFKESGILRTGISETIENETKEQQVVSLACY